MNFILRAFGDALPLIFLLLIMWGVAGAPTRRRRR